jgi:tellurium resistance protein TerD
METSISLEKGGKVDLTKEAPSLKNAALGLGWDVSGSSSTFDLDASAFLLNANGKMRNDKNFVYFRNLISGDGSVTHTGDNLTGVGDGDDETIKAALDKIPADVEQVVFVVNIYQAAQKRQNFGQVKNAFIRLYDADTKQEILKYDLSEDFSTATAVQFGRIYRHNGSWKFEASGLGEVGGLDTYLAKFKA